jgi:hypothetical protein
MTIIKLDPNTGTYNITQEKTDPSYYSNVVEVICFDDFDAGTAVTFVNENALSVNSKYNHNILGLDYPRVDGLLLKSASMGDTGIFADTPGTLYTTDQLIPGGYNDPLYLGQNCLLTNVVPTLIAGDSWSVRIGTKIEDYKFIFDPQTPFDIINNAIPPIIKAPDTIFLSQAMSRLTCFRIDSTGKAFTVTSNDVILPIVDGITLEAGGIDQQVNIARIANDIYETNNYFATSNIYWLTATGNISSTRPTNTLYQVMVGRSVPNSTKFIFDPQLPIKLA